MAGRDLTIEIKAQNQELKQKLAESKRELNEFKRAVKEANSGMSKSEGGAFKDILSSIGLNAGKAGGSLNLLGGSIGKLAGFFGVAVGAGELFNATINSSNQLGDEMERIQTQAGAAVNYFASCLASVDFSNFWEGLQNAIRGGGQLADILDRINSELQGLGVRTSERGLKIAQLEGEAAKLARNDPKRKEIYEQIKKLQEDDIKETQALAQDLRTGAVQRVVTAAGLSDADAKKFMPEIQDLIRNKTDKQIEDIAEAYKKLNNARNAKAAASINTTGTGQFNYKDVARYNQEISKAEKTLKKLGVTEKQAQLTSRVFNVSDNKEDSPLTLARKETNQSYNMEIAAQTKMNGLVARETMLRERMSKAEKSRLKEAESAAKKTYTENAKTEFALKANITALTELRDKTDPLAPTWKAYNDEITETQRKIDKINLGKLTEGSFAKMKADLQQLNTELENTSRLSAKFGEIRKSIKNLEKGITQANIETIDWNDNTKKGLETQKAALNELLDTFDPDMVDAIKAVNDQIKEIDRQLEGFSAQPVEGSIDAIDKQISKLSEEFSSTGNSDRRIKIAAQIDRLEYDKSLMENAGLNPKLNIQPSYEQSGKMAAHDQAMSSATGLQEMVSVGVIGYEDAKMKLAEINKELEKLGMEPLDIRITSKGTKKAEKAVNGVAEALGATSDAFAALGQIAEDPALDVAGIIAGAIANVMFGYAQATVAANSMGPWAWIAFAIAGLATAMATVASIKSATDGYAGGGIIGGNSYSGDNLYARVNSGEMILNGHQQRNLFKAIDEGRLGGGNGIGNVEFVLRGSDLYGTLKNYAHIKSNAGRNINIF